MHLLFRRLLIHRDKTEEIYSHQARVQRNYLGVGSFSHRYYYTHTTLSTVTLIQLSVQSPPIQLSVQSHPYSSQYNHTHITLSTITPFQLSVQSHPYNSVQSHPYHSQYYPIPLSVQSHPYHSQYNHTHTTLNTITPIQLSVQSHPYNSQYNPIPLSVQSHPYNSQYNHTHTTQYNHTHTTLSTITPIQLSELSHPYLSTVTLIQLAVQSPYNSQYCHTHTVLLCASMPELKRVRCDGHPIKSNPERIWHFRMKSSAYRMVCGCGPMGTGCFFFQFSSLSSFVQVASNKNKIRTYQRTMCENKHVLGQLIST